MVDIQEFKRACHAAARATGGRVVEFRVADDFAASFYQAIVAYHDHEIAVVCTRDSAILAVAEPLGVVDGVLDSGPRTWVHQPELAAALAEQPGFQVLGSPELEGPFDSAAWPSVLSSDIAYWRPRTLGEALFNYWD